MYIRLIVNLNNNSSLKSKLFKYYFHTVISFYLIDELTNKTDIEKALYNLKVASTWSFLKLELIEIDLLGLIAKLILYCQYYLQHLQIMQKVA